MQAYWEAGLRLRAGAPLYVGDVGVATYRYAPWFAFLWVPLTYLPQSGLTVVWVAVLGAATVLLIWPMARLGTASSQAAAAVVGLLVWHGALDGNVEPLLALGLARGITTRWAPLAIAVAASLKFSPLVFAVMLPRRGVAWTLGLAAVLTLPTFLYDLSGYPLQNGPWVMPTWLWIPAATVTLVVAIVTRHTRWGGLACGTASFFMLPALNTHYAGRLLVPARQDGDAADETRKIVAPAPS